LLKNLIGAAIIGADVLFGMAAPQTFAALHAETPAHQHGTIAFYAVLAVLTLLVIISLVRNMSGGNKPVTPPVTTFGPRR
jgi:hypothetical protein